MAFRTFKQYIQDAGNCDDKNSYVQECITYPRSKEKAYDYDGSILKLLELRTYLVTSGLLCRYFTEIPSQELLELSSPENKV